MSLNCLEQYDFLYIKIFLYQNSNELRNHLGFLQWFIGQYGTALKKFHFKELNSFHLNRFNQMLIFILFAVN